MEYSLPQVYQITPEPLHPPDFFEFLCELDSTLESGIRLVQLRAKKLARNEHLNIAKAAKKICRKYEALLIFNGPVDMALETDCDGVHLNSQELMSCKERPDQLNFVSAACHSREQISQAEKIGVDFITVSPVFATKTHPEANPIGWDVFSELVTGVRIPVFALGGMSPQELNDAQEHGAWGIAAISSTWRRSHP